MAKNKQVYVVYGRANVVGIFLVEANSKDEAIQKAKTGKHLREVWQSNEPKEIDFYEAKVQLPKD